ncbi:MAG: hypothetical protein AABY15_07680 [Nanoarchaeota archaeon]
MNEKFTLKIPRRPTLKRGTYSIPPSYISAYKKKGITNSDGQIMLFHTTQFGGFKFKRIPHDMETDNEFLEKWFKCKHENSYHHFRANANFLSTFGGLKIKPLQRIWKLSPVSLKEMLENGFSREEFEDSYEFLSKLNEFYSSLELNIPLPQSGITAEDRVQFSRFQGIPYLVKKPKAGGRFFHPEVSYQRIKSSLRQRMTLNGEKTSEVDLSAATLQFLNIALEKNTQISILQSVLSREDPYDYFLSILNSDDVTLRYQEQLIDRDTVKTLLYTAIYSLNGSQENNVNRKLWLMNRNYAYSDFIDFFPEFFDALSALRSGISFPPHIVIFKEESKYAQKVLQKGCLEEKLPILPLHDSFLTTVGNVRNLKEIMDLVSNDMYGRKLAYKQKY